MLTFKCSTCNKIYDASIGNGVFYMMGNKVIPLHSSEQDCENCKEKIMQAVEQTKLKIKEETIE